MYSSKLPAHLQEIIKDKKNTIFVSTVTFWGIFLKYSIGKLDALSINPEILPDLALQSGFKHLPLFPNETASYHQLNAN